MTVDDRLTRQNEKQQLCAAAFLRSGGCLSSRAVSSQVLSVYEGLTSVFGMRTGGTPQLNHRKSFTGEKHLDGLDVFPLHTGKNASTGFAFFLSEKLRLAPLSGPGSVRFLSDRFLPRQYLDNCIRNVNSLRSSPRPISIAQLRTLLHFHLRPIYLVVFKGSYFISEWEILS